MGKWGLIIVKNCRQCFGIARFTIAEAFSYYFSHLYLNSRYFTDNWEKPESIVTHAFTKYTKLPFSFVLYETGNFRQLNIRPGKVPKGHKRLI